MIIIILLWCHEALDNPINGMANTERHVRIHVQEGLAGMF